MDSRSASARITILALAAVLLMPPVPGLTQEPGPEPQPAAPAEPTPGGIGATPAPAAAVRTQVGGCENSGLQLSRSFIGRNDELEWWATGLATGTSVGVLVVETNGRGTQVGSAPVDSLCEASGIVFTGDRVAGSYVLIVSGTRMGGGPVELVAPFNIVSLTHPLPVTPTPITPPLPKPPGGVRALAVNPNTIRVDWTDNSDNEQGFRIDSEAGQFRVPANTPTFSAGGLQPSTIYCFAVYAFNASGESFGGTSCAVTPPRP